MPKTREFPFSPKSTAPLHPGDFFGIPLPNNQWACGQVLGLQPGSPTAFIGTLVDWSAPHPPTVKKIADHPITGGIATHHIKTITTFGLTIDGTRPLDQSAFPISRLITTMIRGGLEVDIPVDRNISQMPGAALGGLIATAINLFGDEKTQSHLGLPRCGRTRSSRQKRPNQTVNKRQALARNTNQMETLLAMWFYPDPTR